MGADRTPAIDDMMMTRPLPRATMPFSTCWVTARVPNTLTSNSRRTRSMGMSAIGPVWPAPALSTRTSMSQAETRAMSSLVMSTRSTVSCGASARRMSACWSVSVVAITWCPRSASARLASFPNPEPAPVIITVLFMPPR